MLAGDTKLKSLSNILPVNKGLYRIFHNSG